MKLFQFHIPEYGIYNIWLYLAYIDVTIPYSGI
jgi:hypothetical protein